MVVSVGGIKWRNHHHNNNECNSKFATPACKSCLRLWNRASKTSAKPAPHTCCKGRVLLLPGSQAYDQVQQHLDTIVHNSLCAIHKVAPQVISHQEPSIIAWCVVHEDVVQNGVEHAYHKGHHACEIDPWGLRPNLSAQNVQEYDARYAVRHDVPCTIKVSTRRNFLPQPC